MMRKSIGTTWLRAAKRVIRAQTEQTYRAISAPTRAVRALANKPAKAKPARRAKAQPADLMAGLPPATVPAASLQGTWSKSYHSAPPPPGRLVNHLSYGLYLPRGQARKPRPAIVMLHGCSQTMEAFAHGTRMNELADRHGFAVIYPEQSPHANAHRCWQWYDEAASAGGAEAMALLSLVDAMIVGHNLDRTRIYLAGLSAGAGMAALLAVRHPGVFAAVALHSGTVYGAAQSPSSGLSVMRSGARGDPVGLLGERIDTTLYPGMPAIILHGVDDHVVAPINAAQLEMQFRHLNRLDAPLSPAAHGERTVQKTRLQDAAVTDHLQGGRRIIRVCEIAGIAHAWSGGDDAFAYHAARGPQASAMLWEFFREHRRRVAEPLAQVAGVAPRRSFAA
jgi:poly(hydroxyalkanoate) depolymerase family esterase